MIEIIQCEFSNKENKELYRYLNPYLEPEERVEQHFNVFDTDDKYDFLKSLQIEKDLFLKLFDLDVYHSILEDVNDSERDRRYNRKLEYMINNLIAFLKEEHRKHIMAL